MKTVFWSGDKSVKMNFNKHDVIAMHAKLIATLDRVHKLIQVRKITASHRSDQTNRSRLLEKLAAWRRTNDFDRSEILAER